MWTGAVLESRNGPISFCVQHKKFASELNVACRTPWALLFAVSGPDQGQVAAIVDAVCRAAEHGSKPGPHQGDAGNESRDHYVYAYFDHGRGTWDNCFYIGKGTVGGAAPHLGRSTKHIKDTLDTAAAHRNEKMRRIHVWIDSQGLADAKHQAVRGAAVGHLVRKLYVFSGKYAEAQAFYVEYFLINHVVGVYSGANDTNGNSTCGPCSAISLPKHFNREDARHEAVWRNTVEEFAANPHAKKLKHTWRPASIALFAAPYVQALDEYLKPLGVVPHPMSRQGNLMDDLMPRSNIQVTGAADATFTYSNPERPNYRLELRFRATQFTTSISLRPLDKTAAGIAAFLAYMDRCVVADAKVNGQQTVPGSLSAAYRGEKLVQNRNDWPFYKPYAPDANGKKSVWFDIANPTVPASGITNWVANQPFELSLVQAIELIICAFK